MMDRKSLNSLSSRRSSFGSKSSTIECYYTGQKEYLYKLSDRITQGVDIVSMETQDVLYCIYEKWSPVMGRKLLAISTPLGEVMLFICDHIYDGRHTLHVPLVLNSPHVVSPVSSPPDIFAQVISGRKRGQRTEDPLHRRQAKDHFTGHRQKSAVVQTGDRRQDLPSSPTRKGVFWRKSLNPPVGPGLNASGLDTPRLKEPGLDTPTQAYAGARKGSLRPGFLHPSFLRSGSLHPDRTCVPAVHSDVDPSGASLNPLTPLEPSASPLEPSASPLEEEKSRRGESRRGVLQYDLGDVVCEVTRTSHYRQEYTLQGELFPVPVRARRTRSVLTVGRYGTAEDATSRGGLTSDALYCIQTPPDVSPLLTVALLCIIDSQLKKPWWSRHLRKAKLPIHRL
ncbi:hypothetical protein GNI_050270 [Gregarina niphandrodes]|uniref:Uncharacterized protein n=1 Tax=Gregarina niphandrodes TaxID=110365 RepID=A0A023B9E6_GRENI|nr:hypothetical protein GNI_050270 [Gregarina niphandrodes]EZG72868.1 hypothetical protein GNI_050270 [Gregarina niphandrodes]|eukprot:XP_011129727.1 hypothetical protein GNI_050270 [Gregarina niphandrodes]